MEGILEKINTFARESGDQRMVAVALEANQLYIEYLDGLKYLTTDQNSSVTVKVDEKTIRFKNVEGLADWLSESMQ